MSSELKPTRGSAGSDPVAAGMSESSPPITGRQPDEEGAKIVSSYDDESSQGPGPRVMAASTLEGDDVVNLAGDKLGTLDEIMIDVPTGRIAYAVLASGGFLGIGDKLLAIPWRALTLDADNECFVLDVAKERLEEAPGFDKDNWPAMANESWAREVHTYYRARPYWE
jgi:sporulation protein YlmC with PRC-barrel domain